jgi:transketolase
MTKTACKEAICAKLIELARKDREIVVLTSDSRGSASMAEFARELPEQFVEVGIAEQNLVGIAAGLAASGKKPFIASYAAFVTMRAIEQVKVDVAYSNVNVKIIGISGGLSYGPLGMSHHALQDIAIMRAIPNIRVYLPADRYQSIRLIDELVQEKGPAYIRVGRNPVEDVYSAVDFNFTIDKASTLVEGTDITIIACGEMVQTAVAAANYLDGEGISTRVINMHTLKPLDREAVLKAAVETRYIVTLEEHSIYGGLGSAVAEVLAQNQPAPLKIMAVPDEQAITGKPAEVLAHYGLDTEGVVRAVKNLLGESGEFTGE